jgi:hypothetical protein
MRRIIPAIKSKIPIAKNTKVNSDATLISEKTSASMIFIDIKKTVPVRIKLVTIRKPPTARLSLTSFCIQLTLFVARDSRLGR